MKTIAFLILALLAFVASPSMAADLAPMSKRFADGKSDVQPSFRRHVIPLMSQVGCSGRSCHGSFQGRGGLQLSLFGYDFEKDFAALTGETTSEDSPKDKHPKRIDLKNVDESLVLLKPTMGIKHGGKQVIEEDSWQYHILRKWIAGGAKEDVKETGEFGRLEVTPTEIVFDKPGDKVQLRVLAHWADGTVEDVTDISRFRTNDESIAEVSNTGLITCKNKGDTHVVAFYDNGVTPVPVMLAVSNLVGAKYPKVQAHTKIDELVMEKLRKVGIVPAGVCDDATFLRRVSLDLTGTLPSLDEIRKFLADKSSDKRLKKINELLDSPAYAAWWATKLCDITGNNARELNERNFSATMAEQWYDWIYRRLEDNVPYDKIAEGIVMATSRSSADQSYLDYAKEMSSYVRTDHPVDFTERPTMPYYWMRRNMRTSEEKALSFSYAFLGVRLQCAQCHKHPFDQWTKQDFDQFKAFFEPITYGTPNADRDEYKKLQDEIANSVGYDPKDRTAAGTNKRKEMEAETKKRALAGEPIPWQELQVRPLKELAAKQQRSSKDKNNNYNGRVITPRVLGGEEVVASQYDDAREPLMEWMRNNNPYFAKAFINRVWASHFGRGIVEPADDLNLANPPSNAALFDYLTKGFIDSGYDIKWLHREILASDTYQRDWRTNETNQLDERNFSHGMLRRLPAEVVMDAISFATMSDEAAQSFRTDTDQRAIGLSANTAGYGKGKTSFAAEVFGKPVRETSCDCERTGDPTLLQTIYMRNDQDIHTAIARKDGWIASITPSAKSKTAATEPLDTDKLVEELFLRTVSRLPTDNERKIASESIAAAKTPVDGLRDLLWTMVNTKEFLVNH